MGFHKDKLVHSEYVSFHWRKVYYQCERECCRRIQPTTMPFDVVHPFPTSGEMETREFLMKNAEHLFRPYKQKEAKS